MSVSRGNSYLTQSKQGRQELPTNNSEGGLLQITITKPHYKLSLR